MYILSSVLQETTIAMRKSTVYKRNSKMVEFKMKQVRMKTILLALNLYSFVYIYNFWSRNVCKKGMNYGILVE